MSLLRNVGIIAHIDAGKTTTTERFLYYSGRLRHLGDVDRGDTHCDFLPEERRRGITIQAASTSLSWRGHQLTLIDTPGHVDFRQEVEGSVRVADCCLLLLDAVKAVQAQTVAVYAQAQRWHAPTIAFVNKMDREGADVHAAVAAITSRLGKQALLLQLPLYAADGRLRGVLDLVEGGEVLWQPDADGRHYERRKPEGGLGEEATRARALLLETLAERDDRFLSLFLASDAPPAPHAVRAAIRRLTLANAVMPVLCGSSLRNTGVQLLMDAVVDYAPSPAELPGLSVSAAVGEAGEEEQRRPVQVSADGPLLALAFKVTHDVSRGCLPLVLVRVYSGCLQAKDLLLNTTAASRRTAAAALGDGGRRPSKGGGVAGGVRERPLKLLRVDADAVEEVERIPCGCIGAVVGLRQTLAGDTLVRAGEPELRLPSIPAPEPVFFASIEPESEADRPRLQEALDCLVREDASLSVQTEPETGQTLLRGQGQLHLDIVSHRLLHDFKAKAEMGRMRVAYRESVTQQLSVRAYSAAHGADALLELSIEPLPDAAAPDIRLELATACSPAEALEAIRASAASSQAAPPPPSLSSSSLPLTAPLSLALQSALRSSLQRGPLLGFPMTQLRLSLTSFFLTQHSTAAAVRSAASLLCRQLLRSLSGAGGVVLLEPMMTVQVSAEKADVGDVVTELTARRRGVIAELQQAEAAEAGRGGREEVQAEVPLTELLGFADVLRSRTRGTAAFSMTLSRYAQVQADEQRRIIKLQTQA